MKELLYNETLSNIGILKPTYLVTFWISLVLEKISLIHLYNDFPVGHWRTYACKDIPRKLLHLENNIFKTAKFKEKTLTVSIYLKNPLFADTHVFR